MALWDVYFKYLLKPHYLGGFPPIEKHFTEVWSRSQRFAYRVYSVVISALNLYHLIVAVNNLFSNTMIEAAVPCLAMVVSASSVLMDIVLMLRKPDMAKFISTWKEIVDHFEDTPILVKHIEEQIRTTQLLLNSMIATTFLVPVGFFGQDYINIFQGQDKPMGLFKNMLIPYHGNLKIKILGLVIFGFGATAAIARSLIVYNTLFTVVTMQKALMLYLKDELEIVMGDTNSQRISDVMKLEKLKRWIRKHQIVLGLNDTVKLLVYAPASISFATMLISLFVMGLSLIQHDEGDLMFYKIFLTLFIMNNYIMLGLSCRAVEQLEQEHEALVDSVYNYHLLSRKFKQYIWMMKGRCFRNIKFVCLGLFVVSHKTFSDLTNLSASALMALMQSEQRKVTLQQQN